MSAVDWQSNGATGTANRSLLLETARDEVEWFYAKAAGQVSTEGQVAPELRAAALSIRRSLDRLPTFHVGALALRFTPRQWPPLLCARFGPWTGLVVRLECAMHPGDGKKKTGALEAEAIARLEASIADGRDARELCRLQSHARHYVGSAIRAYAAVRGFGPSLLRPRGAQEAS
jgi:hypothetical protein